jgi:hypothetical protein
VIEIGFGLKEGTLTLYLPADDAQRRELAATVARLIEMSQEHYKHDRSTLISMDVTDWDVMRAWVKKLDPALDAPLSGDDTTRPPDAPRDVLPTPGRGPDDGNAL